MPQSQQRLYYLDNLRLFLILLIVFHHSSGAYTQAFAQNWFTRDGMMFRDFFFDGIYMMADTVMLQGIFFLSGLFTVFSMTRHEVGGMIRERGMRLLTPLLFVVPLLLPPLSYPRYLDVLKINPTWYGPFPLSYGEYVFSSVFWEKMVAGGPYWFLVFLFLITLIFAGFRQFLGGLYQKLQTWVQGALETSSLRALFSFIGLMSLFVWGGDFFAGHRHWIGFHPYFTFIGSQFLFNSCLFLMGMLVADVGFLTDKKWIEQLSEKLLPLGVTAGLCALVYAFLLFGQAPEETLDRPYALFREGGGSFWSGLALMPGHFLTAFPRSLFFCSTAVFGILSLLGLFYKKYDQPLKKAFQGMPSCTMGIFLIHLPFVIWSQHLLKNVGLFSWVKFLLVYVVAVGGSWGITALLRQMKAVRRIL